jgi:hypothetical protein
LCVVCEVECARCEVWLQATARCYLQREAATSLASRCITRPFMPCHMVCASGCVWRVTCGV